MTKLFSATRRRLRRLWRREDGTATIEFCFCVPVVLVITMASVEAGLYMIRSAMMERGLDLVMRDYRLGRLAGLNTQQVRQQVCQHTIYVADCDNNLRVWIERINTDTFRLPSGDDVYCGDRNGEIETPSTPVVNATSPNEIALVRICALEDPIFPSTRFSSRLTEDSRTGRYQIASSTVVVTEPR